jgi:large subunit ribosomal protein L18e
MKANEQLQGLIGELKKQSRQENVPIWKRIAIDLEKPTRQRRIVNLSKIARVTKENETIIVPGKVLGTGELGHKLTIAAYTFSGSALEKLAQAKCTWYTIPDFMKKNPKGAKTRVIG